MARRSAPDYGTEYKRLMAEVDLLRAEVALLRAQQLAHVCPQPARSPNWPTPFAPYIGDVPPYQGWINVCAGAAQYPQTFMVNTTCAGPAMIPAAGWNTGAAAGVPQILTFNVPT